MDVWGFLTLIAVVAAVGGVVFDHSVATAISGGIAIVLALAGALASGGGPASAPWTFVALLVTSGGLLVSWRLDSRSAATER